MKQLIYSFSDGKIVAEDLPVPKCGENGLIIESTHSLISSGTEKMLIDFGRSGYLEKIKKQPEKAKQVINKIKNDGLRSTLNAVSNKMNSLNQIGYCNVGKVIEVGEKVKDLSIGDRVISNGPHAEYISVERNLCAKIPDNVRDIDAVFCVIASISLQGIRLSKPTLGEKYVVFGLGLIGQLAAQLLKANGCMVLGIDNNNEKVKIAKETGIDSFLSKAFNSTIEKANQFSSDQGVDGVILSLSSSSSLPIKQAAMMCRKRGKIILIGDTKLDLDRSDFYEKEISFQVSCSYGPGRYDDNYEKKGQDYPYGFVRWTQNRNFQAILQLMSEKSINTDNLISRRFRFSDYKDAYELLLDNDAENLGIILDYHNTKNSNKTLEYSAKSVNSDVKMGVIGSGNYSGRILIPLLSKLDVDLISLANTGGVNSAFYVKKYGFAKLTTDSSSLISDDMINTVVIASRHDTHADMVIRSLSSRKNIFCEKPLALKIKDIDKIDKKYNKICESDGKVPILMVGFNRRFSSLTKKAKKMIQGINRPKVINITINAGHISKNSWVQDYEQGGGRIIGEACHFIDLARYLVGQKISSFTKMSMKNDEINDDKTIMNLGFNDGSIASIQYLANGHESFMKERIEIFCDKKIIQINNFKNMKLWGWKRNKTVRLFNQDKGQVECLKSFVRSIQTGGKAPIPYEEIIEVSKISIQIAGSSEN